MPAEDLTDAVEAIRLLRAWNGRRAQGFDDAVGNSFSLRHQGEAEFVSRLIDADYLSLLTRAYGDAAYLTLEDADLADEDADKEIWSWPDGLDAAESVVELRERLNRYRTVDAVLVFDRPILAERLAQTAVDRPLPPNVRLVPVLEPAKVLDPLSSVDLAHPERWHRFGLDYECYTVFVALEDGPGLATALFEVCSLANLGGALGRAPAGLATLEIARRCRQERHGLSPLPPPLAPTPFHFRLVGRPEAGSGAATARARAACDRAAAGLAIGYLAERTEPGRNGEPPTWIFVGHRRVEVAPDPATPVGTEAVEALCELVEWTCDERIVDKHEVIQNLASLRLREEPKVNYAALLAAAPRLLGSAESNWVVYIRRSTGTYFERQKELGELVAGKVQRYGENLATLVKGVAAYGITLLGFFFTEVLLKTQTGVTAATRERVGQVFLVYSLAVLGLLFAYALYEASVLHRELGQERGRLQQFFGERELADSVDLAIDRRRRQFFVFFVILLTLSILAVVWVVSKL